MSLVSSRKNDKSKRSRVYRIIYRVIMLLFLEAVFNAFPSRYDFARTRIPGVLFRLAWIYLIMATVMLFVPKKPLFNSRLGSDFDNLQRHWLITFALMAAYLCVIYLLPVPGCPTGYLGPGGMAGDPENSLCTGGATYYIDSLILGTQHLQQSPPCKTDPNILCIVPVDDNGILGILSACFTCMLGIQAGMSYAKYAPTSDQTGNDIEGRSNNAVFLRWGVWGLLCFAFTNVLLTGHSWTSSEGAGIIPMNKTLWTPTFVLGMGFVYFVVLSVFYLATLINFGRFKWTGLPFSAVGMNSIGVYMAHRLTYSWNPFVSPNFYGLYSFSQSQLFWTSILGASALVAAACYFHHKKLYWVV